MDRRNYRNSRKVVKYRRPFQLNIGFVVFAIIFVYVLINVFIYMNKDHLSIYEVSENNIADDNTCKGVIIREENVIRSTNAGYINYYIREGERVSKNSIVYTADESGNVFDTLTSTETKNVLAKEDKDKILNSISSFQKTYSNDNFGTVYNLKYDIDNILYEATNFNMVKNLDSITAVEGENAFFHKVMATQSGIVTYSIDGMEQLTADQVSEDTFSNVDYKRTQLRTDKLVDSNSPIYRQVTSENWSVIISLTADQYKRIQDRDRIKVTFIKDGLSAVVDVSSYKKGNGYFAKLDLNNYMIRYVNDRYIDVELTLNSASGLKIPKSSIVKKDFFKVPLDYFTEGGDSNATGVIKEVYDKKGNLEFKFIPTEIYFEDENYGYIDTKITLSDGQTLVAGDSIHNDSNGEKYTLGETMSLEGVYNVNKGYTVFRRIEKEYENNEYCIVKKDTPYGLSVYDHIVLNADYVKEQSIIY